MKISKKEGRRNIYMDKKQNKGSFASLGRLLRYIIKNYKFSCLIVLIGIICTALATLSMTLFYQSLIDDYITPMISAGGGDYSALAARIMKLACVLIVGVLCSYLYNRVMVNVSQGTLRRLRNEIFAKMESLPIKYFDTHAHGDIMSVYTNDIDTLRQLISQSLPQLTNSVITLISTFVSMVVLDLPLTAISVVMVIVMLIVTTNLSKMSGKYFVKQQSDLGAVNGYIEEMMEGQKVVKVFCHEEESLEEFKKLNEQLRDSANKANRISNITMPINVNLGNISYVLCAIVGGILALNGYTSLTIGTLVTFLSLNKSFTQPISQISQQISSIVMASAGAERAFALLDEEAEGDSGIHELTNALVNEDGSLSRCEQRTGVWAWDDPAREAPYRQLKGDVIFENVNFGYNEDKQILYDINLYAHSGQKIAFVGSTGAGKTTITNLINRFYEIQGGSITFDGIDIRDIKKAELRKSLGMVLQDTSLFTGTVMENIRYGKPDATDEECIEAAKLANADSFIHRLPEGYNTVLKGSGSNLSQGQRQLLAIARAAVANPPVLILDEATSSIDTRTEKLVQAGMDALMDGRTSFVIAHRLSTVRNSDCIMVMEQGHIIERGTHEDLLEKKGRYYQLYTGNAIAQ